MSIDVIGVLNRARQERFVEQAEEGSPQPVRLHIDPPCTEDDVARLSELLGLRISSSYAALLNMCAGFSIASHDVRFDRFSHQFGDILLAPTLELMGDGFGNFWMLELTASGDAGIVWFVCHDPPMLLRQSATLGEFVEGVLDMFRGKPCPEDKTGVCCAVSRCLLIYNEQVPDCIVRSPQSAWDDDLRAFASRMPGVTRIADFREGQRGSGFDWSEQREVGVRIVRDAWRPLFAIVRRKE